MRRGAVGLALLVAVACAKPPADHERPVVRIDGEIMSRAELDAYLQINLAQAEPGKSLDDSVCSRLLDTWIDERLVLTEAQERMLTLNDETIDDLLDDPAYETHEGELEGRRALLRERLMIQLLQGHALQDIPVPSTAEAREWLTAHGNENGRSVEIRSLRFDDAERAQEVHRSLRRNGMTFSEAVVRHSEDESQGEPTVVEWTALPTEVQQAVENLHPGWSSVPVDTAGSTYLFHVVSWIDADTDARIETARTQRYNAERRRAWKDFVAGLHQDADIEILHRNLPFTYVPDVPG